MESDLQKKHSLNKPKGYITNEYLSKGFSDNFTLALTGIAYAQHQVQTGEAVSLSAVFAFLLKQCKCAS